MKRLWTLLLAALLLAGGLPGKPVRAEEPEISIAVSGEELLPGQSVTITLTVPEDGACDIDLLDGDGSFLARVAENRPVTAGYNALYWNGTVQGYAVSEGNWILRLTMNGRSAEVPLVIGRMIPCLISAAADRNTVSVGKRVTVSFWATEAGRLTLAAGEGDNLIRLESPVKQGEGSVAFDAALPPGTWPVELVLTREDGTASQPADLSLTVEKAATAFTPVSPGNGMEGGYSLDGWTVPMDITDEEAVWQALTAPVTVLDDGKERAQVRQTVVRKEPREDSEGIGTVTLASQGVRVLEKGEEWTRIECYSSSFHDSPILNWNVLVQGYVPTKLLKEIIPNQSLGLVVDKLTQRLYVFRDGKLFSTLLVSTGLVNGKQPYNETRSGEFLLVSRVGGFYSDNMYCPRALRFNDGDLLHEVPYITRNGSRIYSVTEPQLGTKASHGCVRVQRKANPEGLNQEWLFNNYKANTKILVWEDWQGRQIPIPDDDTVFWRHPTKANYYHCSDRCTMLGTRSPVEITYAELSAEDSELKQCPACGPVLKKNEILEINALYAEGGDHNPVLTEARKSCPKKLKER